jgi:lipopolysaccharide biosynthesis glycosyltransferase
MESAVRNCPEKLGFDIIHYDISEETQTTLKDHFADRTKCIDFFKVDKNLLLDITKGMEQKQWALPTWLRLFAPALLPENDSHVIYLDCDTIVCDNILQMATDADLSKPVCSVSQYNPKYKWGSLVRTKADSHENIGVMEAFFYKTYKNLGMNDDAPYFCAGTMLINLDYWRRHRISEQILAFVQEHPERIYAVDQDALNHVINGNYYELHPRWDTLCCGISSGYSERLLLEALHRPAIIHAKGWSYAASAKVRRLYRKYRKLTPYPHFRYYDKTLFAMLKKCVRPAYLIALMLIKPLLRRCGKEICTHRNALAPIFLDPIKKEI